LCDIVLDVYASTEDKSDDTKDTIYKVLQCLFDQFPKYNMKILLRDFNTDVGREDIFKPTIENESLHEISTDNGVKVVNSTTPNNLSRVQCPHIATFINTLGLLLMEKHTVSWITS